ncbi:MAG: diguanylate cyclase [Campylobacterales bacterium]|nr:diguanylate cyclase [Campylobacterales bacterium]
MSDPEVILINGEKECYLLLESVINTQKNLIVVLHKNTPTLFNKAFKKFASVSSVQEFLREFGSLLNRFVPHDSYFHAGKVENHDEWIPSLAALNEQDRVVSMISGRGEPYAFSVTVDTPIKEYAILSFTDISQDLIKRIMIENDASIDHESGAYNKNYFLHTSKSFYDAAEFNKKAVGITMIELMSSESEAERYLRDFTLSIKSSIRQSDMLIRWGKKVFLLAYLINNPENALNFSQKLFAIMKEDPFDTLKNISMRVGTTIQKEKEEITDIIRRAEKALNEAGSSQVMML